MKPGRELDALVAEKVMGLLVVKTTESEPFLEYYPDTFLTIVDQATANYLPVRPYSTDIAAAWEVIKQLKKRFVESTNPATDGVLFNIRFEDGITDYFVRFEFESVSSIVELKSEESLSSESFAHAICLAALKAVGIELGLE